MWGAARMRQLSHLGEISTKQVPRCARDDMRGWTDIGGARGARRKPQPPTPNLNSEFRIQAFKSRF